MYIVVVGLGEVGRHLLGILEKENHDIVAIDNNYASVQRAEENYDIMSLVGYGASHDVLKKAGVSRADLVVAVTNHDEVNLIATLAAKQLGAKRVIARVQGNEWAKWTEGVRYGLLGVDVVINPRVLVAQELAKIARSHGAREVVGLTDDRLELVQMELEEKVKALQKPLSDLDMPKGSMVAAVVRDNALFIPGGADVLLPKDRVYLIGFPEAILEAEDLFTSEREARRVCLVGGGVVGQALAQALIRQGCKVMIIEKDRERAEKLSANLGRVTVVHGDGTDQKLLQDEEVHIYDLFAAVTKRDEVNLMAVLLAQRVNVERTAAIVQRADYIPIYRQLGVDIALSPRTVASDHILRYSKQDQINSLTALEDGQAEVVELTVGAGARVLGSPLRRLDLPRGALVAAISRRGEITIAKGEDELRFGDRVVMVVTSQARSSVEKLFRSRRG